MRSAAVFATAAIVASLLLTDAGRAVTPDEIIQGLADSEALISSFFVSTHSETASRSPTTGRMLGPFATEELWTFDGTGRFRYECRGEIGSVDGKRWPHKRLTVFNGTELKQLSGLPELWVDGTVSAKFDRLSWGLEPREYLNHFFGTRISEALRQRGVVMAGQDEWQGRPVVKIETRGSKGDDGRSRKGQYWIDLDHNFSVVRRSAMILRGEKDWTDYLVVESSDYQEAAPGVWVPTKIKRRGYAVNLKDPSKPAQLDDTVDVSARNWLVNVEMPDRLFRLTFPPQVAVRDERTGATYRTTRVTDRAIDDEVREGFNLYEELQRAAVVRRWKMFLVAAVLAAAAAVVGFVVWDVRRRVRAAGRLRGNATGRT